MSMMKAREDLERFPRGGTLDYDLGTDPDSETDQIRFARRLAGPC